MKELFLNVINNGDYELRDILRKINERHINNDLTDDEKTELEDLARKNANPQNSYAPVEVRLEEAFKRIEALEKKLVSIVQQLVSNEGTETDEPVEGEEVVVEEYPEYVQPLGGHDAYRKGAKITFNGKKYVSLIDGNNWTPIDYPQGWEEVVE